MMNHDKVAKQLTPQWLEEVVTSLAANQPADMRDSVSLTAVVQALSGSKELGQGREGWQAYLRLKQAIKDACSQLAGMRFVEGDS